jgi:altronate dehydratase
MEWLVPQRILNTKFGKILTVDELRAYDAAVLDLLATAGSNIVHVIGDAKDMEQFPSLAHGYQIKYIKHPNFGWSVMIGIHNPLLKAIGLLLMRLFDNRLHFCNSQEEAITFLQSVDKTLTELK